ncbi:VOC family protein [Neobacillus citreus]|uniref:VOC family protein n=1 Tax=Neobacillus citreus TaxID=2833578 RepID=A0A942T409_9BACI|nr:VOC family protein [Neobacillus citreus]MCH6266423.1 VOC family protein [Neobacillus citreus]
MIKGINHKAFHVVNMERSLDFYCNKLGFKRAFELNQPNGEPWIVYVKVAEGCFIELFYGGVEGVRDRAEHICFEVDDINKTADQLKKKGVHLAEEISQGRALNYQFWVIDPDGNWLEFMEMHPESLHMRS